MNASFPKTRKRLLPALIALSVGLASFSASRADESDSSSVKSARGTVVFVTPSKPAVTKHAVTSKSTPKRTKRLPAKTPSPIAKRRNPKTEVRQNESAQGDLVLVPVAKPQSVRSRTFNSVSEKPAKATRESGFVQQIQPVQALEPESNKMIQQVRAESNRRTISDSSDESQEVLETVSTHQPEVNRPTSIAKLLINAHAISLQATTESDFTEIIKNCASALDKGAENEEQQFAYQLISWALNRRGQIRIENGEQEFADADFQEALEYNPENWRALHNRGVSLAQHGSFADAFDDFSGVIQLNPEYAKAFVNRATLFMQANDLQSALEDYQVAAELDPEFAKAQLGLGRAQQMLGEWDEAIVYFDAAVRLSPDNAEILCSRGDLLADMGQYGKALADYALAIEVNPEFAHAYRNGSWLLATCPDSQFRDAENALLGARQALVFDYGQRHVALDTLAAALASSGQFDEAISTLEEALALAPEKSKSAYFQRLELYQNQQPFRTQRVGEVAQVVFEVTDKK